MILRPLLFKFRTKQCSQLFFSAKATSEYDLIVLGGGSGGLACAKEAADLGKKVVLLDFVVPSPHGTKWGIGGTCVNVGCIPKKIMHQAGLIKGVIQDAKSYGWSLGKNDPELTHDWGVLVNNVNDYIKSLNWIYRVQLREKKVDYINAFGSFIDKKTILARQSNGQEKEIKGANIVVAAGVRPKYPNIPGAEYGISSDDLFSLKHRPGKTLVVGASYVALECAGFLASLNYPVSLLIRSIPLRGFDQQMAGLVVESLKNHGVNVFNKFVPLSVEKLHNGKLKVEYHGENQTLTDVFDTVLWAIGREPLFENLNLSRAGVKLHESGKIAVDEFDRTNVDNIYAIGDVQFDHPELTPVAIMAGKFLARRLFAGSKELMDYENAPTTVFTPTEYGVVGLPEAKCIQKFGADEIEVVHSIFKPLEYALPHREEENYLKIICKRNEPRTVLGIHFLGPNAGEVIQGFSAAFKMNITLDQLQSTICIHPTAAEEVVRATVTKRSGLKASGTACCG